MPDFLFVYGTLHPTLAPRELSGIVKGLRQVGRGWLSGRLYDLGEYPGAVLEASSQFKIVGDVFELRDDPALLKALDDYEGFIPDDLAASLFVRIKVPVTLSNHDQIECWIYVYNHHTSSATFIADGDYLKWKGIE